MGKRSWSRAREHLLGVVGVQHQGVLGELVAVQAPVERGHQRLGVAAFAQLQLEHLAPDVLADQRAGLPLGDDPAVVHDQQPVAQPGGLLHVVRGQQQGHPLRLEALERSPDRQPGLRVEPGGRLVEDDQVGLVDQRPGDQQPALHAPGQRPDAARRRGRAAG